MKNLSATGLTVRRGGRAILAEATMLAQSGEFVAVIGANGAGKSTLLATLAGLLHPDSGSIGIGGTPIAALSRMQLARMRAYLPQNPRCEWPIAVERLIALGLTPSLPALGGLPAAYRTRIDAMLAEWDLVGHRDQAATTLSGGELARAMLARALVGDPDILIVDEPITGLDPRHALETVGRLRDLARSGKLVVASLHDVTLAARYATRVVALHHGRIAADGTPQEVLTPALLGDIFEVEASVDGANGGVYVDFLSPLNAKGEGIGARKGAW